MLHFEGPPRETSGLLWPTSLVPRPKQPQRRSLAVSRGEGGSGHLTAGNADLRYGMLTISFTRDVISVV